MKHTLMACALGGVFDMRSHRTPAQLIAQGAYAHAIVLGSSGRAGRAGLRWASELWEREMFMLLSGMRAYA